MAMAMVMAMVIDGDGGGVKGGQAKKGMVREDKNKKNAPFNPVFRATLILSKLPTYSTLLVHLIKNIACTVNALNRENIHVMLVSKACISLLF